MHTTLQVVEPRRKALTPRAQFVLFLKILLKEVDRTSDRALAVVARAIVKDCTLRNRLGDPLYRPLRPMLEQQLFALVGQNLWLQAQLRFSRLCRQKGIQQSIVM